MLIKLYLLLTTGIFIILNINTTRAVVDDLQSIEYLTQNFFDSLQNDPRLIGEY